MLPWSTWRTAWHARSLPIQRQRQRLRAGRAWRTPSRMATGGCRGCSALRKPALTVASTGVIGQTPEHRAHRRAHVPAACRAGASDGSRSGQPRHHDHGYARKRRRRSSLPSAARPAASAASAKGSGMIHPNMGTMLSFITTDCAITHEMLTDALHGERHRRPTTA